MAGKDLAAKATTTQPKSVARRLWRVVRAVLYMLRHGVLPSGRKIAMDLSLLLRRRGKTPGKALGGLVNFQFHHHHGHHHHAAFSSATASGSYSYDAADIARVFEMLNESGHLFDDDEALAVATPSPALWAPSAFGATRQLLVTDSPFAATNEDSSGEQQVDRKADEFIRRFYEQLRAQKSAAATPNYYGYAASSYNGDSPRPVAAGVA